MYCKYIEQRGTYGEAYFLYFLNAVVTISNSKNATSWEKNVHNLF